RIATSCDGHLTTDLNGHPLTRPTRCLPNLHASQSSLKFLGYLCNREVLKFFTSHRLNGSSHFLFQLATIAHYHYFFQIRSGRLKDYLYIGGLVGDRHLLTFVTDKADG